MKLSAVAAFLIPPRSPVAPAMATDPSAARGATAERTSAIEDTLELSPKALEHWRSANLPVEQGDPNEPIAAQEPASKAQRLPDGRPEEATPENVADGPPSGSTEELSEEQQQQVTELKQRDTEVRAHEQAHVAAGGSHVTGGPTYEYQEGPDGRRYAVGGEVQIDTSPVDGDPEATLRKAQIVRAAALAPAEPSSQDRAVAAAATQMAMQAQAELQDPSRASKSTEGNTGQASTESTDGDAGKTQTAATQTYGHQAITKAIAAQLKTTAISSVDFYV